MHHLGESSEKLREEVFAYARTRLEYNPPALDGPQSPEGRNAGQTKAEVEAQMHQMLGTNQAIWLKRGLTCDYDEFGTRGHGDIVACFAPGGKVLVHVQEDPQHPDFEVSKEVLATFAQREIVLVDARELFARGGGIHCITQQQPK